MTRLEPYEIRVLGQGDAQAMRRMLECFSEAFEDPDTYSAAQPDDDYLDALLADRCFFAIAAVCADGVIGGLAGYELRKFEQARSELYIYDLAVDSGHRRRGVATALIEAAREIARNRGAWMLYVQADLGDDPAIALYSGLGTREDVLHFDIPPKRARS